MCKHLWKTKKNSISEATLKIINKICDVDELKILISWVFCLVSYRPLEISQENKLYELMFYNW